MLIVDRQKAKKKKEKKVVWKEQVCRKLWFKGLNLCNIQKSSGEVPTGFVEKTKHHFVTSLKIQLNNKQDIYVHFITKQ